MVGLLAAYLAYGTVMSAVFGPAGDVLLGPATAEETLALERTTRTSAVGLGLGGLAGAAAGLALLQLTASAGQPGAFNAPPTALVLALGLVGAALGLQAGSLAGLPGSSHVRLTARRTDTIAATTFVDHVPERATPRAAHRPLRHLHVVAAVGECTRGYAVGDVFECGSYGKISPPLCPPAERALRPLVAAMARGDPDAPRTISCPIYDHMLVLRLNGASPERAGALARR